MTGAPAIAWTRRDVQGTLRAVGPWWAQLLAERPAGPAAPAMATLAAALGCEATAEALGASAADAERQHGARWSEQLVPLAEAHLDAVAEAGAALRAATARPAAAGTLLQLNASGGGVPKRPLDGASVGWRGLEGDRQAVRQHHGRAWQALSLWSADVIATLVAEGHPVAPGTTGENLTVAGVDWALVRAGALVHVGEEVVAEVTVFATPCRTIAASFLGRGFDRIDDRRHPGSSRVYAAVRRPGVVRPGDVVRVEPT